MPDFGWLCDIFDRLVSQDSVTSPVRCGGKFITFKSQKPHLHSAARIIKIAHLLPKLRSDTSWMFFWNSI